MSALGSLGGNRLDLDPQQGTLGGGNSVTTSNLHGMGGSQPPPGLQPLVGQNRVGADPLVSFQNLNINSNSNGLQQQQQQQTLPQQGLQNHAGMMAGAAAPVVAAAAPMVASPVAATTPMAAAAPTPMPAAVKPNQGKHVAASVDAKRSNGLAASAHMPSLVAAQEGRNVAAAASAGAASGRKQNRQHVNKLKAVPRQEARQLPHGGGGATAIASINRNGKAAASTSSSTSAAAKSSNPWGKKRTAFFSLAERVLGWGGAQLGMWGCGGGRAQRRFGILGSARRGDRSCVSVPR